MYKPKVNKKIILELSLDLLKVIKKKIKEELNVNQPKKNKKVVKSLRGSSSGNTGKNTNNLA
jgi:hypothetical protein